MQANALQQAPTAVWLAASPRQPTFGDGGNDWAVAGGKAGEEAAQGAVGSVRHVHVGGLQAGGLDDVDAKVLGERQARHLRKGSMR